MVAVENPVLNGAQLVKAMADSGAGVRTLAPARERLAEYHRKYGTVAPANEILAALDAANVSARSLDKAKQLAETGRWVPPEKRHEVPVEERLLAGMALPEAPAAAPVPEKDAGDRAEVESLPATALKKVQQPTKKPPVAAE